MARAPPSRFETIALSLAIGGVLLRLISFSTRFIVDDTAWYAVMARTLDLHGEFTIPWSPGTVYTQHFPPLYPAILAAFFLPFGPSMAALEAANFAGAVLLTVVAFATTTDLYGRKRGFAVAAVAATFPILVGYDALGLSETFVTALFALTIWAILKSLDKPRFIMLAGVFAGLSYLSKASMGPFVLLAGAGGFAWRFYYVKWGVFRDKNYLAAVGIFALLATPWLARNWIRFQSFDSQPHATHALRELFTQHASWVFLLQALLATTLALVAFALPFLPGVRASFSSLRDEKTSGLWMAVVTPAIVATFFVAAFGASEGIEILTSNLVDRYVVTCLIPLLWLGMRTLNFDEPVDAVENREVPRRERILRYAGLAVLAIALALRPTTSVLTTARILVLFGSCLAAYVLLFVARGYHWSSSGRAKGGSTSWRAQVTAPEIGVPLLAFPLVILAFVLDSRQIILFAGGAALLMATPRGRVVALCVGFLAAALSGSGLALPGEDTARDVNALAQSGDTVAVMEGGEKFVAPFVREDVAMVHQSSNATFLVEIPARERVAPDGYHLVKTYDAVHRYGPGTVASRTVERWITGDILTPDFPPMAYLYARNATAPEPSRP